MTNRALAMPAYIADLVRMPLARLGLDPSDAADDVVTCLLTYEDGSELTVVVMCVGQRGWFREKAVLLVSVAELDQNTRATRVHFRETMPVPKGPHDLQFAIQFSAKVRAIAWSLAATSGMGECVSLPGRPVLPG